ncbi:MAG: hypothetical protein WAX89_01770 [Alphaproteobacteria bacterium]
MQTYVVFMRNSKTGEEFSVPVNAYSHTEAMTALLATYPARSFIMHTAYAVDELQNTLEHVRRWPGVATKPQKEVAAQAQTRRPVLPAAPSVGPRSAGAEAQLEQLMRTSPLLNRLAHPSNTPVQPQTPAQPRPTTNVARPTSTPASVISMLKAMRG